MYLQFPVVGWSHWAACSYYRVKGGVCERRFRARVPMKNAAPVTRSGVFLWQFGAGRSLPLTLAMRPDQRERGLFGALWEPGVSRSVRGSE